MEHSSSLASPLCTDRCRGLSVRPASPSPRPPSPASHIALHSPPSPRHEHGALSPLVSLNETGRARTWRLECAEAKAGEVGSLRLHVGQCRSDRAHTLLIQVVPMQSRRAVIEAEQLSRTLSLRRAVKGERRSLRFGPVCAAGDHLLNVLLDGAHVIRSPTHLHISPAQPHAPCCEVRPGHRSKGTGVVRVGAQECISEADAPIAIALVFRDPFRNRCGSNAVKAILEEGGLDVKVHVVGTKPQAERVPGEHRIRYRAAGGDGVVQAELICPHAALYEVAFSLHGEPIPPVIALRVRAAAVLASACTAFEEQGCSPSRCTAGRRRQLKLVARDASGNVSDSPPTSAWSLALRGRDGEAVDESALEYFISEMSAAVGQPQRTACQIATFRVCAVGCFKLSVCYGGAHVAGSPFELRSLPAAWGPALLEARAGVSNRFWVRLSDEGDALPGSPAGRKRMHSMQARSDRVRPCGCD